MEIWRNAGKAASRIIASTLGITEIRIESLWIERDFGKGEGMELEKVQEWHTTGNPPTAFEPIFETGETEWQVHLRAGRAVEKLIALREGKYNISSFRTGTFSMPRCT